MPISTTIEYARVDELQLDSKNPRLGREITGSTVTQNQMLEIMQDWDLDELATSFIANKFWPNEALIVVEEKGKKVVVEGNRRLATLKLLENPPSKSAKWNELAKEATKAKFDFKRIPYFVADTRADVDFFLAFRHVTGIKEWAPAEKAEFIAKLVEQGNSYEEVRRRIGSKAPTVRQNYIAYRLLLQMENTEEIEVRKVENKFSVLYLSLRSEGTRAYLSIDLDAPPGKAHRPVPKHHLRNLENFARWVFGDENHDPVVPESRDIDEFGKILESKAAVKYLETTSTPTFEAARRLAGSDEGSVVDLVRSAAAQIEEALGRAHLFRESKDLRRESDLLFKHASQLQKVFGA